MSTARSRPPRNRKRRRQSTPPKVAMARVEGALQYFRMVLLIPPEEWVQSEDQVAKAQAKTGRRIAALAAAYGTGDPAVIQAVEAKLRAHLRSDHPPHWTIVLPESERGARIKKVKAWQAQVFRHYDEAIGASRKVLESLAQAGGDALYILSVLLGYTRKGTKFPEPFSIGFRRRFAPSDLDWASRPLHVFWTEHKEASPPASRRQKGPAEMAPSAGMALLDRHLRRTTGRHHLKEIAALFRVWVPWLRGAGYLTGKHVYQRVRRVKKDHGRKFRLLARTEDVHLRALENDFRLRSLPSQ